MARALVRGVALAACFATFAGCAGPAFTNQPGAAGSTGATSGTGARAGAGSGGANGGATAGNAGSGGRAGGAGTTAAGGSGGGSSDAGMAGASDGCQCATGQYCRAGSCFDCSDVSQLDFGAVEQVLDYPDGALRFPRPGGVDGSLFYTLVTTTVSELWYAPNIAKPPGGVISDARVANEALDYFGDPGSLGFDVLLGETAPNGARSIQVATWDGTKLGAPANGPVPLAPLSADDYSASLARATSRVYFMTTRSGAPALVTGTLGNATTTAVDVKLPGQGGGTCARSGDDATPWVTSDGKLLLFSAPPVDSACNPVDGTATDLFVALVNATSGLPLATAVPLAGVNHSTDASNETDASFSADLCTLYFASDGGGAQGHDFRLYRASRR
jgi:hypothetical protein